MRFILSTVAGYHDFLVNLAGCPAAVIEDYSSRFSFTCGRCEQRATAAAVRFLGRRVYVAAVLMLASPSCATPVSVLTILRCL